MSKIKGISELQKKFSVISKEIQQEVKEVIEFNLGQIEMEAIRNAPSGGDRIKTEFGSQSQERIRRGRNWVPIAQAIGYEVRDGGYSGSVFVESSAGEVAVWVEMGTGQSAKSYLLTVPPEWRALAAKYYINGKGTIIAQPYLLPAYFKYAPKVIEEMKQVLKNKMK